MKEYRVREVEGGASALEKEINYQASLGWQLHSFEIAFVPGYLRYVVVFEKEKN